MPATAVHFFFFLREYERIYVHYLSHHQCAGGCGLKCGSDGGAVCNHKDDLEK